ncbi:MAG: molybdenum cofactor biosynthesis protein MoaE [Planctomycetota bacterium]|nr:MAG: molybdenum cofactor biosynthesis protein MoaE [Planctomycetota bacterium]
MAAERFLCRLQEGPLEGDWARRQVEGPDAGCTVEFRGTVRNQARGRSVEHLEYEAYARMVPVELGRIAEQIFADFEVLRIAVEHATGKVEVGRCSVVVAVASAHRQAAFDASAAFMDALKVRVPLWKKEVYPDGSSWIGRGS